MTRTKCISLESTGGHWTAGLRVDGHTEKRVSAKTVINAAGPWVDHVAGITGSRENAPSVRLVKGSHIIVPSLFDDERCFIFQAGDGRIVFAIPYENGRFTLIGTTDLPFDGDLNAVSASDAEIDYLCKLSHAYFDRQITPDDVVSTYSGVRPLFEDHAADASSVTRDYVLKVKEQDGAQMLSVIGGKITTYRKLAEDALKVLKSALPKHSGSWTATTPLPGGDIAGADFDTFERDSAAQYPWLDAAVHHRLARTYGTRLHEVLKDTSSETDLGHHYGAGLYQQEVDYLVRHEFARTCEDILDRRTKLGLHMSPEEISALRDHFDPRLVA